MGGYGSGRKAEAHLTEDYRAIDIRDWQRKNRLSPGYQFKTEWMQNGKTIGGINVSVDNRLLKLSYSVSKPNSDEFERLNYPVKLETTPCHFGGIRYWFICPAVGCGRRVAILYQADKYFCCRHCYQLVYKSQRQSKSTRGFSGASKVREKLGWSGCIVSPPEGKPKGMHWRTYINLLKKHIDYSNDSLRGILLNNQRVDALIAKYQLDLDEYP